MTVNEIIKALECCQTEYERKCEKCPYEKFKSHGISFVTCSSRLRKDLLDLVNYQKAEIDRLESDLNVANQLMKDRERMPIPYDEDEFLRKAILKVIGWIEDVPWYKTFGTVTLTKTRVDEWKANIKKGGETDDR